MLKINRCFLGFFLAMVWPSVCMLSAEEPSPGIASQGVVAPAPEEATPGMDSAIRMAQQEIRDPFATAPEPEAPAIALNAAPSAGPEIAVALQGIGFGSKDAYAVIGGEVFYQGDEKKGIKLVEVRRREVDILVSGGKVTVPLFPDQDLQKAKDRAEKKIALENASEESLSKTSSSLPGREQPPS